MKKFALFFILLFTAKFHAQMFTNADCQGGHPPSSTFGPMNTAAPIVGANNRTICLYDLAELSGIANKTLTSIFFKKAISAATLTGSSPNFKIYLKETADVNLPSSWMDWATAIVGATLVYDSDPTAEIGTSLGYREFLLSTPFYFSGTKNLAIYMEYYNPGASNSTIKWQYNQASPCTYTTAQTVRYINSDGALKPILNTQSYIKPLIGFNYSVLSTDEAGNQTKHSSISPNPVNSFINIKTKLKIVSAQVYDMNGKLIEVSKISDNKINVKHLANGAYILSLNFADGTRTHNKFIKN